MREGYRDLKKLSDMEDWEWEQLTDEELEELEDLLGNRGQKVAAEKSRRSPGPPPGP